MARASVAPLFEALAHPTRLAIVERLLREGECPAGSLAEPFGIALPTLSRHLKVLSDAGVIERRAEQQFRLYRVRPQAMRRLDGWFGDHRRFWNQAFDRLDSFLQSEKEKPR
jgi:DNA-binding transcriptional ArsR family regulator